LCGTRQGMKNLQYFQILNSVCFALLNYKQQLHLDNTIGKSFKGKNYFRRRIELVLSLKYEYNILSSKRIWYIHLVFRINNYGFPPPH
jgi:hypothetical protein